MCHANLKKCKTRNLRVGDRVNYFLKHLYEYKNKHESGDPIKTQILSLTWDHISTVEEPDFSKKYGKELH